MLRQTTFRPRFAPAWIRRGFKVVLARMIAQVVLAWMIAQVVLAWMIAPS